MRFVLATLARRARNIWRKRITLRDIQPARVLATNLYRAAYLPIVQTWQAGLERILAEYARTLASMTQDSPADLGRDIDAIGEEIQRLILRLTPRLRDWIIQVESWHRGKWRGAVLSASGVDLQTLIGPEDVAEPLEAVLRRNVELVRDISDEARGRIADAVFRGLTNRTPARDVARNLREAVGLARGRALRVASDQLTKATATLDTERMRQAGIEQFKYRHSGKLHARPWHKARDGKIYNLATGQEIDGEDVIEPDDAPGVPPYCGCRKQAHVVFD